MNPEFKLTESDIKLRQEDVLETFYSGIKAKATKESMERILKYFLINVCADLFNGDFSKRAQLEDKFNDLLQYLRTNSIEVPNF